MKIVFDHFRSITLIKVANLVTTVLLNFDNDGYWISDKIKQYIMLNDKHSKPWLANIEWQLSQPGALLLAWVNFNPSKDKSLHPL